jgi:hypothetical protein
MVRLGIVVIFAGFRDEEMKIVRVGSGDGRDSVRHSSEVLTGAERAVYHALKDSS